MQKNSVAYTQPVKKKIAVFSEEIFYVHRQKIYGIKKSS